MSVKRRQQSLQSSRSTEFDSTRWSVVLSAGQRGSPQALATLCESYWYPLYAYVRRRVKSVQDAQDLTQAFFTRLLEKDLLQVADPQRGRFRKRKYVAVILRGFSDCYKTFYERVTIFRYVPGNLGS